MSSWLKKEVDWLLMKEVDCALMKEVGWVLLKQVVLLLMKEADSLLMKHVDWPKTEYHANDHRQPWTQMKTAQSSQKWNSG